MGLKSTNLAGLKSYQSLKEALGDVNKNLEKIHVDMHKKLTRQPLKAGARDHSKPGIGNLPGMNMSPGMGNMPNMHNINENPLGSIFGNK